GPDRGGNVHASVAARHEIRNGKLKGWVTGVALLYRNDFVFSDGFTLQGGWRADVMFGYRLQLRPRHETLLQFNAVNLADRSWQLTRFAPDHGRQLFFSVTQEF